MIFWTNSENFEDNMGHNIYFHIKYLSNLKRVLQYVNLSMYLISNYLTKYLIQTDNLGEVKLKATNRNKKQKTKKKKPKKSKTSTTEMPDDTTTVEEYEETPKVGLFHFKLCKTIQFQIAWFTF